MVLFQKMTEQFPKMFSRIDTVLNFQKKNSNGRKYS